MDHQSGESIHHYSLLRLSSNPLEEHVEFSQHHHEVLGDVTEYSSLQDEPCMDSQGVIESTYTSSELQVRPVSNREK